MTVAARISIIAERSRRNSDAACDDRVGPFVAAVEFQRRDGRRGVAQPLDVAREKSLPYSTRRGAVADQRLRHALERVGPQFRRDVAADGDDAVDRGAMA